MQLVVVGLCTDFWVGVIELCFPNDSCRREQSFEVKFHQIPAIVSALNVCEESPFVETVVFA